MQNRRSTVYYNTISEKDSVVSFTVKEHHLMYLQSGHMEVEEGGRLLRLKPGECVFIRKDNRVRLRRFTTDDGQVFQSISLAFKRNFLQEEFRKMDRNTLLPDARRTSVSVFKITPSPESSSLFLSMTPFFDSEVQPDNDWLDMKLREGLRLVMKADRNVYASLFDFADPWKIDILGFLNDNYMYDMSLQEMANFTGRSLSGFKRDFSKVSELTPEKWIIRRRLQRAHEILSEGGASVQEAMEEAGISNLSYFSRAYKEMYGIPPSKEKSVSL